MPRNPFTDRPEESKIPSMINVGDVVEIITKDKQGSDDPFDLITGIVKRVLSKGKYYRNGCKVELEDGTIGRIQYIVYQHLR